MKKFIIFILLIINPLLSVNAYEKVKPCCQKKNNGFTFKAIIFDCDGTLIDSESIKFRAWQEALRKHKINFNLREYKPLVGNSSNYIFDQITKIHPRASKINKEVIINEKNNILSKLRKAQIKPFPSAIQFLKKIAVKKNSLGIKIGLASSAPREEIISNLERLGIKSMFDAIVSGQDDLNDINDPNGKNKPKPYVYIEAAKRLEVNPKDCLVFEDSEAGVNAAHSAGMTVYAFPNKFTKLQNFENADKIIKSWQLVKID